MTIKQFCQQWIKNEREEAHSKWYQGTLKRKNTAKYKSQIYFQKVCRSMATLYTKNGFGGGDYILALSGFSFICKIIYIKNSCQWSNLLEMWNPS